MCILNFIRKGKKVKSCQKRREDLEGKGYELLSNIPFERRQ